MIKLNNKQFAESAVDYKLNPSAYSGVIRRYKTKLEIFDKTLSLVATINRYGVPCATSINADGVKVHKFAFSDNPIFDVTGGRIQISDLRDICRGIKEHYINTIPDGGMFKAFPDHEYRYR